MRPFPRSRATVLLPLFALLLSAVAFAQEPDSIAGAVPDTLPPAVPGAEAPRPDTLGAEPRRPDTLAVEAPDSAAAAERDSLAAEIARELEEMAPDTTTVAPAAPAPYPPAAQVAGAPQSFNPDLSVIGDFLFDFSPEESTLEEGDRFQVRETELGFQSVVDPYFRGDFFIALKGEEIELEEGYLTSLALPHQLQLKLGKFHLPYGKVNLTHRPEIRTIEYPRVIQEFFGDDGFASTGLWVSKLVAPFGFYQEVIGVVGNDLGEGIVGRAGEEEAEEGSAAEEDEDGEEVEERDLLEDLGDRLFLGHLKNYVDLTEAANLEVGLSVATGKDRPTETSAERLTFYGVDAIYRWRPPAKALYRSLVVQTEASWRSSDAATDFGAFLFGQLQVGRRWYVSARYDFVQHPDTEPSEREHGISGYVTLFPSEFSLFRLGYEHRWLDIAEDQDRLLLQTVIVLGPHRPHPF